MQLIDAKKCKFQHFYLRKRKWQLIRELFPKANRKVGKNCHKYAIFSIAGIRRIQAILLKVALVLGAQVYPGVEFNGIEEPDDDHDSSGWRISVNPSNHPINLLNIDVLIGAEGKRVSVPGFKRKEFRGKLAIAITANFQNRRTTAEAVVEEISGVAFVYKQDFFNNLYEELGIALENIVYYKDETHYFVMTTKKHSLLDRGVLKKVIIA